MSLKINSRAGLIGLATATALISACTMLEGDKIDYRSAGRGVSLEVPPDLTQLDSRSRYTVDDGSVSATAWQAGEENRKAQGQPTASSQVADVHYIRDGQERWLKVDRPAEDLWNPIRDFWLENGFLMSIDQRELGIMETDWAENRAKIPQDFIRQTLGKILDSLYSTGERDKFRTRLERTPDGGTDIFITHSGMIEEFSGQAKESTVWEARPRDNELETEFLRRLMVHLGSSKEQSDALIASSEQAQASASARPARAQVIHDGATPMVQLDEDFNQAWRRVGLALDRSGFTVEDRNRSQGIYYVRYVDPAAEKKEPGFFGKIFGGRSAPLATQQYQIVVREQAAQTTVRVDNIEGQPAAEKDAQHITQVLVNELK